MIRDSGLLFGANQYITLRERRYHSKYTEARLWEGSYQPLVHVDESDF